MNVKAEFGWEKYNDLGEIYTFLDDSLSRFSNVLTSETVGHSYHGTEIRAVKLSHKTVAYFFKPFYVELSKLKKKTVTRVIQEF